MDTSETYIKMCDCGEIQAIKLHAFSKDFEAGDYYLYRGGVNQGEEIELADSLWQRPQTCVWLPRQDQLQEMVGGFGVGFIDWFCWRNAIYPHMQNPFNRERAFTSWEQLWLAFVMKEKHNKTWDGDKWKSK